MVELVHELHLLEHVGPVRAVLVHLEHHHLPRRLVRHLKESRQESQLERGKTVRYITSSPVTPRGRGQMGKLAESVFTLFVSFRPTEHHHYMLTFSRRRTDGRRRRASYARISEGERKGGVRLNSTATDRGVGLVWFPKGSNLAASKRHQVAAPERGGGGAETARQRGEQTHRPAGPRNIKLHERLCKILPIRDGRRLQFEHIRGTK